MDIRRIFGGKPSGMASGRSGGPSSISKIAAARRKAATPSIFGADLQIVGDISSAGVLQIDGTVQGDIRSMTVTIGETGQVNGSVVAETVRVCGSVSGRIEARSVEMTRSARVTGDILYKFLSIELGAYLGGNCQCIKELGQDTGEARSRSDGGEANIANAVPNPLASKKSGSA